MPNDTQKHTFGHAKDKANDYATVSDKLLNDVFDLLKERRLTPKQLDELIQKVDTMAQIASRMATAVKTMRSAHNIVNTANKVETVTAESIENEGKKVISSILMNTFRIGA